MLPSEVPRLVTDLPVRVFPGIWKLLSFFKTLFPGRISVPTSSVSLFIFYIFSYLFWLLFWVPDVLLWNLLSVQMFL